MVFSFDFRPLFSHPVVWNVSPVLTSENLLMRRFLQCAVGTVHGPLSSSDMGRKSLEGLSTKYRKGKELFF